MELLLSPDAWVAFLTLLVLEVVLGVDNVIFISILSGKLPPEQRDRARITGLSWHWSCGSPCCSRCPG